MISIDEWWINNKIDRVNEPNGCIMTSMIHQIIDQKISNTTIKQLRGNTNSSSNYNINDKNNNLDENSIQNSYNKNNNTIITTRWRNLRQ